MSCHIDTIYQLCNHPRWKNISIGDSLFQQGALQYRSISVEGFGCLSRDKADVKMIWVQNMVREYS